MDGIIPNVDSVHTIKAIGESWHHKDIMEDSIDFENSGWNFEIERIALRRADLKAVKELILKDGEVSSRIVYGHFAGEYLMAVVSGKNYELAQPKEIFESVRVLLDEFGLRIVSSGTVYGRKNMFMNLESVENNQLEIASGDFIRPSLRVVAGNDKSVSPSWYTGATRIVCANTFRVSMRELSALMKAKGKGSLSNSAFVEKIRHSKNFLNKLGEVKQALTDFYVRQELLADALRELNTKEISSSDASNILLGFAGSLNEKGEIPTRTMNVVDDIVSRFENGIGNKGKTLYDLFNGFTEKYTRDVSDDALKGFVSSEFGRASDKKESFMLALLSDEQLEKLAKKGEELLKGKPAIVEAETV
jgi:hypothetical protein